MKFSGNALIIEDNPVNQMVLKAQLLRLGFNVDVAENGVIGLDLINNKTFDIIFMDIQMPVMDGLECTKQIRKSSDENISQVPIIAVTANVTKVYRDSSKSCGMNGFLEKPLDRKLLVAEISKYLSCIEA